MSRSLTVALAVTLALGAATTAHAQDDEHAAQDALRRAETAYVDVDFEAVISGAMDALTAGGLAPSELARTYELLGVASAALGDQDTARDCFLRMLSIDESRELDDTVPPRLRGAFMEARGALTARPDRLGVEVVLARAYSALRVEVTDPFEMIQTVRVHIREEGTMEWTDVEEGFAPEIMANHPRAGTADRLEYWLEVLDPTGNQILVQGSEFEPLVVGRPRPAPVAEVVGGGGGGGGPSIVEEPLFWIILGSVVAVGAGIGIGVGVDQASHVDLVTRVTF